MPELTGRHGRRVNPAYLAGLLGTAGRPMARQPDDADAQVLPLLRPLTEYAAVETPNPRARPPDRHAQPIQIHRHPRPARQFQARLRKQGRFSGTKPIFCREINIGGVSGKTLEEGGVEPLGGTAEVQRRAYESCSSGREPPFPGRPLSLILAVPEPNRMSSEFLNNFRRLAGRHHTISGSPWNFLCFFRYLARIQRTPQQRDSRFFTAHTRA